MKAIVCILFVVISIAGKAQQMDSSKQHKQKVAFGLAIGLGYSDLPGLSSHSLIHSSSVGLGWLIPLNNRWRLAPELKLTTRGTDKTDRLVNAVALQNARTQINTYNIDIPLMVQYQFSDKVFAGIGAQLSFLASAEQSTTGQVVTGEKVTVIENVMSLMHKEGFMIPIEIGFTGQRLGSVYWTETFRYNFGVMEAFTTSAVESKYQSFQLCFTIFYRANRKS